MNRCEWCCKIINKDEVMCKICKRKSKSKKYCYGCLHLLSKHDKDGACWGTEECGCEAQT